MMKVAVIGLGLIGGSMAKAVHENAGLEVYGTDADPKTVKMALDEGTLTKKLEFDNASDCDLFIVALYPKDVVGVIKEYAGHMKPGAIVVDCTGVKSQVCNELSQFLSAKGIHFVGGHPMAGKESSGIENASSDIFKGANYIVTPTEKNTEEAILLCKEIGRLFGFGRITLETPEEHDRLIGFLSQLAHCIAISLMTCCDTSGMASSSGDSFRDLTRIAKINDEMWSELFLLNRDVLTEQMDLFSDAFQKLRNYIESGDREAIRKIMKLSTKQRKLFDKVKEN